MVTGKEIKNGSVLLSIPRHVMISSLPPTENDADDIPYCDLTRRWPLFLLKKLFISPNETQDEKSPSAPFTSTRASNLLLSLCLIHETKKQGSSFYQPYLNVLPNTLSQPLVWKKRNVNQLKGSAIYSAVQSAKKQLEDDYAIISDILFTVSIIFSVNPKCKMGKSNFLFFQFMFSILVKDSLFHIILGQC